MRKFTHEKYHEYFATIANCSVDDSLEKIYRPVIAEFQDRADSLISSVKKDYQTEFRRKYQISDLESNSIFDGVSDWERLFPYLLEPKRINYAEAGLYMIYRLMTNGNTIYNVSPNLVDALHKTDFEIDFSNIDVTHKTFIVYWGDKHNVRINDGQHILEYTFVDMVYFNDILQMRVIYGYTDDDGDDANSGIATLTITPDNKLSSSEFVEISNATNYSQMSQMVVDAKQKNNNSTCFLMVMNFLLYLMAVPEDRQILYPHEDFKKITSIQNPKKRRKIEKRLSNESRYRYVYIGFDYDRELRESNGLNSGVGKSFTHKTLVRGHWRHQWYGPKQKIGDKVLSPGTSQKLIWIRPFWKGEEIELVEKSTIYQVR